MQHHYLIEALTSYCKKRDKLAHRTATLRTFQEYAKVVSKWKRLASKRHFVWLVYYLTGQFIVLRPIRRSSEWGMQIMVPWVDGTEEPMWQQKRLLENFLKQNSAPEWETIIMMHGSEVILN